MPGHTPLEPVRGSLAVWPAGQFPYIDEG